MRFISENDLNIYISPFILFYNAKSLLTAFKIGNVLLKKQLDLQSVFACVISIDAFLPRL